jgi:hypothetical protein
MSGARLAFIAPMVLVAYTYVGYPLLLWVATRLRPRDPRKAVALPSVSIIIAARNEADKIRRKIERSLALDYPERAAGDHRCVGRIGRRHRRHRPEYAGRGVRLVRAPQRKGKEHAQGWPWPRPGRRHRDDGRGTLLETGARTWCRISPTPRSARSAAKTSWSMMPATHGRGRVREVRDVGAPARAGFTHWSV